MSLYLPIYHGYLVVCDVMVCNNAETNSSICMMSYLGSFGKLPMSTVAGSWKYFYFPLRKF